MNEQMRNPMHDKMQDGMLIVRDEVETQTQLIPLSLGMSLPPYNLVATSLYSLRAFLENRMGDSESCISCSDHCMTAEC